MFPEAEPGQLFPPVCEKAKSVEMIFSFSCFMAKEVIFARLCELFERLTNIKF